GQSAQGRTTLDEMAGITSSQEQPANMGYDMLELFNPDDPWNGLFPSSGSLPAVRYSPWNQPEYQEPPEPTINETILPRRIPTPAPLPGAKRGRKLKEIQR